MVIVVKTAYLHLFSSSTAERRLRSHRGNNRVSPLSLLCYRRETPPLSSWQQQGIATYSPLQQQSNASAVIVVTTWYHHLFSSATAERRLRGIRGNVSVSSLIHLCNSRETPTLSSWQQQCIDTYSPLLQERRLRGLRGSNGISPLILLGNNRETPPRSSWQLQCIDTYSSLQ